MSRYGRAGLAGLLLATGLALPGAAQQPATVQQNEETRLTVETVDVRQRTVLVRDATGALSTFDIGREVPDLARIRPGDQVVVTSRVAFVAAMARPGGPTAADMSSDVRNPPRGQRPGERTTDIIRARVRIESFDPATGTVRFVGPRGVPRQVVLRRPQMLEFARTLRPGDEVDLAYKEEQGIRVEPMRR
jgi:hypothetical protein